MKRLFFFAFSFILFLSPKTISAFDISNLSPGWNVVTFTSQKADSLFSSSPECDSITILDGFKTITFQRGSKETNFPITEGKKYAVRCNQYSAWNIIPKVTFIKKSVLIFVDNNTFQPLTAEINRLKDDITRDLNADVFIATDFTDPISIRQKIKDYYLTKGLLGSILIGDVPYVWSNDVQGQKLSITDQFYQNLDDESWVLAPNGNYDPEYGIGPENQNEVWSGRIMSNKTGQEGLEQIRQYLNKDHNYRTGALTFQKKMFYYGNFFINQELIKYPESERVGKYREYMDRMATETTKDPLLPFYTPNQSDFVYGVTDIEQKNELISKLKQPYEFGYINTHGWDNQLWFGSNASLYTQDINNIQPQTLFVFISSCKTGDFRNRNSIANELIFNGNTLGVAAFTAVMILGDTDRNLVDFAPLRLGIPFGEAIKVLPTTAAVFFGDPTLRLRNSVDRSKVSSLELSLPIKTYFEVKDNKGGESLKVPIFTVQNKSPINQAIIEWSTVGVYNSVNEKVFDVWGKRTDKGYTNIPPLSGTFVMEYSTLGFLVSTINPNGKKDFAVEFNNSFKPWGTQITDFSLRTERLGTVFITNDPENPYLKLDAAFRVKPIP